MGLPNVRRGGAPDPINRGAFAFPSSREVSAILSSHGDGGEPLDVDAALGDCVEMGASDVFIRPDSPVWYRVNGRLFPSGRFAWVSQEELFDMAMLLFTSVQVAGFRQELELDASHVIKSGDHAGARFRVSMIYSDDHGVELVLRYINPVIGTPDALGVPDEVVEWSERPRGLVLVTGPTGSGKSTSLSSLIRRIQLTKPVHILTIESPVETVYPRDGVGMVTQREVGKDTLSFQNALVSAMRDSPDVILVGEMRTNDEISATVEAADTGHLTFSTLHTKSAEETILRITSKFEGEEKRDILARLSSSLVGIMSQQLLQRRDGRGRVAVHEMLPVDREVSEMVMAGDVMGIHDYMMRRRISMDHQLLRMVASGDIGYHEALGHAMDRSGFIELAHGPNVARVIDFDS